MKILFLCKSNVTRSQMAEAFFNKYSKKHKAESAALIMPQNKMHKLVIRAMTEKGIDISKQKSKKLSKEMTNEADLIILLNLNLKKYLSTNKKIEIWNIPDIVAKETDEHLYLKFIKIREMVEEKVKELLDRIE